MPKPKRKVRSSENRPQVGLMGTKDPLPSKVPPPGLMKWAMELRSSQYSDRSALKCTETTSTMPLGPTVLPPSAPTRYFVWYFNCLPWEFSTVTNTEYIEAVKSVALCQTGPALGSYLRQFLGEPVPGVSVAGYWIALGCLVCISAQVD